MSIYPDIFEEISTDKNCKVYVKIESIVNSVPTNLSEITKSELRNNFSAQVLTVKNNNKNSLTRKFTIQKSDIVSIIKHTINGDFVLLYNELSENEKSKLFSNTNPTYLIKKRRF